MFEKNEILKYIHSLPVCMTTDNNMRIIFRPTKQQYDRLHNLYSKSGRYKHFSEMLRHVIEEGINVLETEH